MNRWIAACYVLLCVGCQAPRDPVSIHSEDPDLEITAMKRDVYYHNTADVPTMVNDLSSDDPAIRFYSIQSLHRLTHDDFGYRYYETDEQRAKAVEQWHEWLKQQK